MPRNPNRRRPLTRNSLERLLDQLEPRRLFAAGTDLIAGAEIIAKSTPYHADRFWTNLDATPRTTVQRQLNVNTQEFEPFTLDASRMRQKLANAPLEDLTFGIGRAAQMLEISVPTPEGTLARFNLVESSVMEPALQAQFPEIRTYAGHGVDDPAASIRLDFTLQGFHAQVLSAGSTYYVDPYYHLDQSVYASYYRRDAQPMNEIKCDVDELGRAVEPLPGDEPTDPVVETTTGTQLRTYRLALAATGGYTAYHGGTVALGASALTTLVNRLTGVYENDLTVRLTLVANNNNLVYTNAATDPYTYETVGSAGMLTQNQSNIDTVIGSANYDIGHVVDRITGGGDGIAGLGVVGVAGSKARGVTGFDNPIGDPFAIDFVAHEMGHQFGGNHTFNTSSAGGNRNASTAYEPGSASTIMGYAGITGNNSDLQPNSDPYFAWISQQEIINRCDNVIPGVGTRTATGNSLPTVNGGLDYTIPAQTPFALTASGSDANAGDVLTYSWEESDLGAAQLLNAGDNGTSPIFRVYNPTVDPTRYFPRLPSILSGANSTAAPFGGLAERLPTTNRQLKFRVTVRDNRAGGGAINTDDVILSVVNTGAAFGITSFNSGGTFAGGSSQTVTWNVAGTTASPINAANVKISLSTDGGTTFPNILAASTANDGTENVIIPNIASNQVRIKVEAVGNIFFDINNANLAITAAASSAPGTPDLDAVSDTGVSNTDDITKLNNSNAGNVLSFTVPNTVSGATVELLIGGAVVGSAVATGSSTTVVTNGAQLLNNGNRIATARQTQPGLPVSAESAGLTIRIDFTAPVGDGIAFDRLVGPHQFKVTFSEDVSPSLTGNDLSLANSPFGTSNGNRAVTYNGGTNVATFTLPDRPGGVLADGNYVASINRLNVTDIAGNNLASSLASEFSFLVGDADGDSDVDLDDFTTLAANFGSSPRNFSQGDFSYSGAVDLDDFTLLASNFGVILPPAGSLPRSSSSPFSEVKLADRLVDVIDTPSTGEIV